MAKRYRAATAAGGESQCLGSGRGLQRKPWPHGIPGHTDKVIYSDSVNAMLWVSKKQCKTKLERTPQTAELYDIIARAEAWLRTHAVKTPILKWETKKWGEIPADFGRK